MPTAVQWLDCAEESFSAATRLLDAREFRSAVSRSYYCLYQSSHGVLVQYGFAIPTQGNWTHGYLPLLCMEEPRLKRMLRKVHRTISQTLERCYEARCNSDYRPEIEIAEADARQAVREANGLLAIVRRTVES